MPARREPRLPLVILADFIFVFAGFALWHMFPPAPYGLADDWRVFYAAGSLVWQGGNPYDNATIHAAEQAVHYYAHVQPSLDDFANLPVVALPLALFSLLPYWTAYAVFTAIGVVLATWALVAWCRAAGWRRIGLWVVSALFAWITLLGFLMAQFDALLLAGAVFTLLLCRRRAFVAAGVLCAAVVLIKPHIIWPMPLLMWAVGIGDRRGAARFAAGGVATAIVGLAAGFATVHNSTSFAAHLLDFARHVNVVQPDLAGLPGLVAGLPGGGVAGNAIAAAGFVLVLAAAAVVRGRDAGLSGPVRELIVLTGLAVWLTAAPYAHPNDDVLLLPLLAVLAGERGDALAPRWLALGLLISAVVAAAFLVTPAAGYAVTVALAGLAVVIRGRLTPVVTASIAVAAIGTLPAVWPFHLLTVPVTPVAVLMVTLAAVIRLRADLGAAAAAEGAGLPSKAAMPGIAVSRSAGAD